MTTTITITGQINGNNKLADIIAYIGKQDLKNIESGSFYSKRIIFSTKRAAKKALWGAYKTLCADEPDQKGRFGGIRYSAGSALYYDASQATIS